MCFSIDEEGVASVQVRYSEEGVASVCVSFSKEGVAFVQVRFSEEGVASVLVSLREVASLKGGGPVLHLVSLPVNSQRF